MESPIYFRMAGSRVLVHCRRGISRSASTVSDTAAGIAVFIAVVSSSSVYWWIIASMEGTVMRHLLYGCVFRH